MQFIKVQASKSVEGREIAAYINHRKHDDYIYLIAGMHGNEPEGVYVLEKLFAWLNTQDLRQGILVVPAINPDGLAANNRCNANAVDLNRNWPTQDWTTEYKEQRYFPGTKPLSEPENIFLHSLFSQYPTKLIFSFHSWLPMLDHNVKAKAAAEFIAQYNNYPLVTDIGYPTPGSLGKYAEEKLNCGILTYECPEINASLSLEDIWLQNEPGLKQYFIKRESSHLHLSSNI